MHNLLHRQEQAKKLSEMIGLVALGFVDKYDKGGTPYVMHCLTVMQNMQSIDFELLQIAVGHDLLEDTDIDSEYLRELGFSERVISGIECITKVKGETYEQYKSKVKSNFDSVLVKMQDLKHNSCLTRLKGTTQKDVERVEKYMLFYVELQTLKNEYLNWKGQVV